MALGGCEERGMIVMVVKMERGFWHIMRKQGSVMPKCGFYDWDMLRLLPKIVM